MDKADCQNMTENFNNKLSLYIIYIYIYFFFSEFFEKAKRQRFFDDLSDDDEYQNMTEEERNEKMAPKSMTSKLNLDGAVSFDDESSDEEQIVKVS